MQWLFLSKTGPQPDLPCAYVISTVIAPLNRGLGVVAGIGDGCVWADRRDPSTAPHLVDLSLICLGRGAQLNNSLHVLGTRDKHKSARTPLFAKCPSNGNRCGLQEFIRSKNFTQPGCTCDIYLVFNPKVAKDCICTAIGFSREPHGTRLFGEVTKGVPADLRPVQSQQQQSNPQFQSDRRKGCEARESAICTIVSHWPLRLENGHTSTGGGHKKCESSASKSTCRRISLL